MRPQGPGVVVATALCRRAAEEQRHRSASTQRGGYNALSVTPKALPAAAGSAKFIADQSRYGDGRGRGVGRCRGIGFGRGVGVGRTVAVGVAVGVGDGVGVGVGVIGGVGVGDASDKDGAAT